MFIPLGDDNSDRRIRPAVNYALIGLNVLVFIFLQGLGENYRFTYAFSKVPQVPALVAIGAWSSS